MLAYADYSQPFIVYTDASSHGLGAVLAQVQEGQERVIAYASRSLHPTEQNDANYSSFKLELLALKWAVTEKFKDYLTGVKFTIYTDNNPVAHLQTARLGAVEQRWVARLAAFTYDIKFRSGKSNVNADALSRFPVTSAAVELTPAAGPEGWAGSEWRDAQAQDVDIQVVARCVAQQKMPPLAERRTWSLAAQKLLKQWKKLQLKDEILYRKVTDSCTCEVYSQVVCPGAKREEVWKELHVAAAHAGLDRTLAHLRRRFYWPGMEGEVRHLTHFQQGCVVCSLDRVEQRVPVHPFCRVLCYGGWVRVRSRPAAWAAAPCRHPPSWPLSQ